MAGGWASLGLLPELVEAVEEDFQWMLPTDIQDEAIPLILGGGDVMASAETGSGKTAAFALPILQLCVEQKLDLPKDPGKPQRTVKLRHVMSLQDRDSPIAIDPNSKGLRIQSRDPQKWSGCRASVGIRPSPGDTYTFECTVLDEGIVRVGWSAADASLQLGTDVDGFGYGGTGVKVWKGKYEAYPDKGESFGKGDVVGCHLTVVEHESKYETNFSFSKNGISLGTAFTKKDSNKPHALFPTVCMKNAECEINLGEKPLCHPIPQHKTISDSKLGEALVVNPRDAAAASLSQGKSKGPLAIVIEPTRDLAEQTYNTFSDLAQRIPSPSLTTALLVGGVNSKDTLKRLQKDQIDILVGTPPIIASNMKKDVIHPSRCMFFVLDEADALITTDSVVHIRSIYSRLLAHESTSAMQRMQVCFFSATLHSKEVRDLASTLCHRPLWVDLRGPNKSIIPEGVHNCVVKIDPSTCREFDEGKIISDSVHRHGKLNDPTDWTKLEPDEQASERIKLLKPQVVLKLLDKFEMDQVIVFCRTNLDCDLLEKFFRSVGGGGLADKFSCRVLAGMRSMDERRKNLQEFKDGEFRILIATDVAARGIDIRELPFVINYTLPDSTETYVHRIGRVGRAERMGLAISLVGTEKERVWFCRKGKKPPCPDTSDFDKGGNCIWYDEPKLWSDIESMLRRNKISTTDFAWPEMTVPSEIMEMIEGKLFGNLGGGSNIDPEVEVTMKRLGDQARLVETAELELQSGFWNLQKIGF